MSKAAYYFSHDANARSDSKIMQLRSLHGLKGYGAYWIIIELLKEAGGFLDMKSKYATHGLALEMDASTAFVKDFLKTCVEDFGLFEMDADTRLFSPSLLGRIEKYETLVQKRKDAASKRWTNAEQKQSKSIAIKEKETKLNKIKVNYNKPFIEPCLSSVCNYLELKGVSPFDRANEMAESFHNFYASKGWMVGKNKMKSWEAAANQWISRKNKENRNNDGKEQRAANLQERSERPVRITI